MAENFVRSEYELEAEFTDAQTGSQKAVFRDIVSISATFALNSIPVAALVVACGKEVNTGADATIHSALKLLKPRDKVKVTLTVRSNDGETSLVPSGKGVIFEGYYVGTGYQRANNQASYTLHLIHWIDDLNCSSMINGNWHPGVPHDLAQAASIDVVTMKGGANPYGAANPIPAVDPTNEIIKPQNIREDMWAKIIKPLFEEIASFSHPREQTYNRDKNPLTNGNNAAALAALARMPGSAPEPGTLPLFLEGVDKETIEAGVRTGVSMMVTENMAYSSFWSKLVGEFAPAFLFAVSPCPEFANVVPFFGGLSRHWKEIDGREYNYANFNSSMATLIESIEIRHSQKPVTNWTLGGPSDSVSYYVPWGIFPRENPDLRGQIIVRDAPRWVANAFPLSLWSSLTVGLGQRLGDPSCPGRGPEKRTKNTPTTAEIEKNIEKSNLLNLFCEHWYKTEVLSQRYGELSGKLRFDIAPGSIVKIKEPALSTASEVTVYAAVTHVSFLINAEQHTAGTSFTLLNLRTELENDDPNSLFTSAEAPLYPKGTWRGGPLVKELSP